MLIKRLLAGILLEEVEDVGLLGVPGETVVYHAGLELREAGCLGVDGFEGVGVFGVGVDGAVDAEFGVWEWWDGGEEFLSVWVGHCGLCVAGCLWSVWRGTSREGTTVSTTLYGIIIESGNLGTCDLLHPVSFAVSGLAL